MSESSAQAAEAKSGFWTEVESFKSPEAKPIANLPAVGEKAPSTAKLPLRSGEKTLILFLRHCGCPCKSVECSLSVFFFWCVFCAHCGRVCVSVERKFYLQPIRVHLYMNLYSACRSSRCVQTDEANQAVIKSRGENFQAAGSPLRHA